MPAFRNIRLCTKDCLCLFVCPTGATDTENGQIDFDKCIKGCRACVDACPSGAISLLPDDYPKQQEKTQAVVSSLMKLAKSKAEQELAADTIAGASGTPAEKQLAAAIAKSNRIMAEDLIREAGYMLPQSDNAKAFLNSLLSSNQPDDFPKEVVEKLITIL